VVRVPLLLAVNPADALPILPVQHPCAIVVQRRARYAHPTVIAAREPPEAIAVRAKTGERRRNTLPPMHGRRNRTARRSDNWRADRTTTRQDPAGSPQQRAATA
jgi:hypothetical protein